MRQAHPASDPAALLALSQARSAGGDARAARDLAARAVELDHENAAAWGVLGACLHRLGEAGAALAALRRAAALAPSDAAHPNTVGVLLQEAGHHAEAGEAFRCARRLKPDWGVPALNLGLAEHAAGGGDAAAAAFADAVELMPENAEAWNALGAARQQAGAPESALAAYSRALELRPDLAAAHANMARTLRALGRLSEALAACDTAVALAPGFAAARWNRAIIKLLAGRLDDAWEDFEWRWKVPGFPSAPRGFAAPLWGGEPLDGRRILLHAEQGFGDTLQFLRYVPLVAAAGGTVILEVQPELPRIAERVPGTAAVLARGEPLPPFDLHAPLLSLPRAFRTDLSTIPADTPYLSPPPDAVARWRGLLPEDGGAPRVGLVWAGRPTHANDRARSIPLAELARIIPGAPCRFFSLQAGPPAAAIEAAGLGGMLVDLSPQLTDFAETAAALCRIDLLVTVDTAVAHLGGALGRPVVVLLSSEPDWRWMLDGADTPWYPTMRLRRRRVGEGWAATVADVAAGLRDMPCRGSAVVTGLGP